MVAPDQRGYGRSDHPDDVDAYSILHLVGDVVGLVHALGEETAYVVGHDWGAPVAWYTALLRPDMVRAVAGLSVPPPSRGTRAPRSGSSSTRLPATPPGTSSSRWSTPSGAGSRTCRTPRYCRRGSPRTISTC
ncbi:alpha/beta fold hydrolase [Streptomyces sp. DT2A-34]|uniref:alpha/beta fold hydrolase n=1 Tax=Streptomyces sp. DT2A-34 TaxID=3051182 RepID=UPI003463B9F8